MPHEAKVVKEKILNCKKQRHKNKTATTTATKMQFNCKPELRQDLDVATQWVAPN